MTSQIGLVGLAVMGQVSYLDPLTVRDAGFCIECCFLISPNTNSPEPFCAEPGSECGGERIQHIGV